MSGKIETSLTLLIYTYLKSLVFFRHGWLGSNVNLIQITELRRFSEKIKHESTSMIETYDNGREEMRMSKISVLPKKKEMAAAKSRGNKSAPSQQEIHRMIEIAAYFKAEHRNFAPGYEDQDWLEAEQEISTLIGKKVSAKRR